MTHHAPPPDVEVINANLPRGRFRAVLFDFDGTLSLIREGWPQVMIPLMVEVLRQTPTVESDEELARIVEDFVMRLNGRQTIYQMMQLAQEVRQRGGTPREPLEYKHMYHDRLMARIENRLLALKSGSAQPADWTVPGSHSLLQQLASKGMSLYLASGTDLKYVRHEAELLDLAHFFEGRIFGALDDHWNFSKKMIIERMLAEAQLHGPELLGFGDGFVEIEELKRVGGVAIGVASDEVRRQGINDWKRRRLIAAGADVILGDYRHAEELIAWLWDQPEG
jgi:phosphoglycolate phosphatase-like HAD superfamily hydrolase